MPAGRTKAEQSEATRAALIAAARRLFAERGYAGTATEEIVEAAGVTRGALYHQFKDKRELFVAVFETLQREVLERLGAAGAGAVEASPLQRLRGAFQLYLDICMEPEMQRIVLLDGRAVLGWDDWARIEASYGLPVVVSGLGAAMESGEIAPQAPEPLAHLLLGAVNEAAFNIAAAEEPGRARAELGEALDRLFAGL